MTPRSATDIYLDANATTRVLPRAATAAQKAMEELFGNPSSSHITGLRSRYTLESTRDLVKSVLGVGDGTIIFTSGATEAIQTAIFSALCCKKGSGSARGRLLLYGATEHKAVPQALAHWNDTLGIGDKLMAIPVDSAGKLDLGFLREHAAEADMVCTMAVNNETGVISGLDAIEAVIRECNAEVPWLVDLVQGVGKTDINLSNTTIDYAAVSGHKLHAPKGIGLLYARKGAPLKPLFAGGGQERGARSGTENLPGVAALGEVFRCLAEKDATFKDTATLESYRKRLVNSLKKALPPIVFNTPFQSAVPTTINFSVRGFASKEILDLFDAAGIRVSSGSACGSALQGSYVLEAMGLPKWRSDGAIRLSFSPIMTDLEITMACVRIEEAGQALRESCLIVSDHVESPSEPELDGLIQLKTGSMCSWLMIDAATSNCVIIDPFEELGERIESIVRCRNCRVLAVLDTHKHVDHESPRTVLLKVLTDKATDSAHTEDVLGWPTKSDGKVRLGDGTEADYFRFSEELIIASADLPGHTVISKVFLVGTPRQGELKPEDVRFAFTGDTLLIGGIGRTDFPCSTVEGMYESLRKLPKLVSDSTMLCPTHDYSNHFATTLPTETRENDLLARVLDPVAPISLKDFGPVKAKVDAEIDDASNCELVCGRIIPASESDSSVDVGPDDLEEFFEQHRDSLILDVREPHEYRLTGNWSSLGFAKPPVNVPLTRLGDFVQRMLASKGAARPDTICICRSGNRSRKAAEVFRRLGIPNVWHVAGGIALGEGRDALAAAGGEADDYMI